MVNKFENSLLLPEDGDHEKGTVSLSVCDLTASYASL